MLPLLYDHAAQPELLMALLVAAPGSAAWNYPWMGMHTVPAIIAGAISGALHGPAVFPQRWRTWAEPLVHPWLALTAVVQQRRATEGVIITLPERLRAAAAGNVTVLHDKVRGCLLAGAVGNAMGSPVEGCLYPEVDARHPGGIHTILEPWRLEAEDDNQLAALLVETYLQRGGLPVTARHFGAAWKEHFDRDHFFVQCMGHAYDLIMAGWDPRITGHWTQATGSTVMCMEPVGLYHALDPEFAAIDATAISYLHQRGLDVTAATMLAATVAEALRPEASVDSVCQAALAAAPTGPFKTFDRRPFESPRHYIEVCLDVAARYTDVLAARRELYEKCLLYSHMDPLELWGLALAMFRIAQGDVRQAAIGGTNIGRDRDTIAGRGAMLSGTLRGAAGVPAEWIALFGRPALERIDRNAARLAELLVKRKLPRLQRRQAVGC